MSQFPPLTIELYMDGADLKTMQQWHKSGKVQGFTTNPSLMKKAGITDYQGFAREVMQSIPDMPVSFEVFSDDLAGMEREARIIAKFGKNCYVKIPVTNTKGESTAPLIKTLSAEGIPLNITALFTLEQVKQVAAVLNPNAPALISVFAGRINDAGQDAVKLMKECAALLTPNKNAKLLWASTRELYNIIQAQESGCHIITVTPDVLAKTSLFGKDLNEYSLETVKTFYADATAAGFKL